MDWLTLTFSILTTAAFAAPSGTCFDYHERVTTPLEAPPALIAGKIAEASGIRGKGPDAVQWAGARAWVPTTLHDATEWILDHTRWKEMEKTKLDVSEATRPGYVAFHTVKQDTKVFAFVRIQWTEDWAYTMLRGTLKNPEHLLTTYQKTEGTSHIRRLCGSVDFQARAGGTDAYFYQEANADHYGVKEITELHRRFLTTLGAGASADVGGVTR